MSAYQNTFAYDSVGNHLVATENVMTYTFDASGNQQIVEPPDGGRVKNVWDYENQRTLALVAGGSRVTAVCNADNRRVQKEN